MKKHHYSSLADCERLIKTELFFASILGIPLFGALFWHWSTVAHTFFEDHGKQNTEEAYNIEVDKEA